MYQLQRQHVSPLSRFFPVWVALAGMVPVGEVVAGSPDGIRFDLPPVAAARPLESAPQDPTIVTVELRLSSMIASPKAPTIDQWLVRCQPRDTTVAIADYAPRTETGSDVTSPIQVKQSNEKSKSVGLALDGNYGHIANAKAGTDHGETNIHSVQYDRQAPVHAVTAAGTINRGRGVYFKLRWTSQQILEGEKLFRLTLRVPKHWRGSLIDVSVVAEGEQKSFGWERDVRVVGSANFVVATYRAGDRQAEKWSHELADAEYALRQLAMHHQPNTSVVSLPSMLHHVAVKLDLDSRQPNTIWMNRLLLGQADPHLDETISKLPMPIRIAALDYTDVRDEFSAMNRNQATAVDSSRVVAAKPPLRAELDAAGRKQ